jgi:hypothetical protein
MRLLLLLLLCLLQDVLMLFQRCLDVLFYDIQMVASVVHSNRMLEGMTQVWQQLRRADAIVAQSAAAAVKAMTRHQALAVCPCTRLIKPVLVRSMPGSASLYSIVTVCQTPSVCVACTAYLGCVHRSNRRIC